MSPVTPATGIMLAPEGRRFSAPLVSRFRVVTLPRPVLVVLAATGLGVVLIGVDHGVSSVSTRSGSVSSFAAVIDPQVSCSQWWLITHLALMLLIPFVMLWAVQPLSQDPAARRAANLPQVPLLIAALTITVGSALVITVASMMPMVQPFAHAATVYAASGPFVSLGLWAALFAGTFAAESRRWGYVWWACLMGVLAVVVEGGLHLLVR